MARCKPPPLASALWKRRRTTRRFAWSMGVTSGVTTMLANGAGPIMTLYFLATETPKIRARGHRRVDVPSSSISFKVPFS